jgi:hypothetical protein
MLMRRGHTGQSGSNALWDSLPIAPWPPSLAPTIIIKYDVDDLAGRKFGLDRSRG